MPSESFLTGGSRGNTWVLMRKIRGRFRGGLSEVTGPNAREDVLKHSTKQH